MLPSNVYTVLTSSACRNIDTTPATSATVPGKPAWEGKPAFELSCIFQEDFNDTGDNWSGNGWPPEVASKDPFSSANALPASAFNPASAWGNGAPVEIPAYHTHFTVLDSMDHRSGDTHYLLESNQGMLFHGHVRTSEWNSLSSPGSNGSQFASLPDLTHVPADFLFPHYHPSMTPFSGDDKDEAVYMKKQSLLPRAKFRNRHHARCTLQEIARCERISMTPHANLARYLGVETKQIAGVERVVRIAYQRYSMDLHTFVLMKRYLQPCHVPFLMHGIESGMRHLHTLGLVHCDLRPMNVFVTIGDERGEDGHVVLEEVVIGDFDASVEAGEKVALKRASGDWWPAGAEWGSKAEAWIDEWCLEKMGRWLKEDGLGIWDFGAANASPEDASVDGTLDRSWLQCRRMGVGGH
ncbi:serine/threonine-protein kinase [Stagonosporopsis vannaccii]|nr:serine/threonine-protein kinase [Stagonosporopsis vannaccii]